jgi:hypothetical protein
MSFSDFLSEHILILVQKIWFRKVNYLIREKLFLKFKLDKIVRNIDPDFKLFDANHIVWFELVFWKLCIVNSQKNN